jgi:stage II sporulation protein D
VKGRAARVVLALCLLSSLPSPAVAQTESPNYLGEQVELIPGEGTTLLVDGRSYRGSLRVGGHREGLALVERVGLDGYLLGIREVPFSWHREALKAQVVAARTYLAWTLQGGRSAAGRAYGYDICATAACQVYAGTGDLDSELGARWRAAVSDTGGEILLYEDGPAQALYSSTSGGRTRDVDDVWPGTNLPYLQAVDSPGEDSPFVSWGYELAAEDMEALLRVADLIEGSLEGITTEITPDGAGPWQVVIESTGGTRRVPTWDLRGMLNQASRQVLSNLLPATRPDGRRYPQTVLSPTYTIHRIGYVVAGPDGEPMRVIKGFRVEGRGWGHLVGMSQYGALAMAEAGASYQEILGHYYSGLAPVTAPELLPETVTVGLAVEEPELAIGADGPVQVIFDGTVIAEAALGTWRFQAEGGSVRVLPPVGLGLPPVLRRPQVDQTTVGFALTASAEMRVTVFWGTLVAGRVDLGVVDAGVFRLPISDLLEMSVPAGASLRAVVEVSSPDGEDTLRLAVVPGLE